MLNRLAVDTALDALAALGSSRIGPVQERRDPYQDRMEVFFEHICRPDYPAGMIPWLGEADPSLYELLTETLPNRISRLWADRAPLSQFDATVDSLLQAHRTACALYLASKTV